MTKYQQLVFLFLALWLVGFVQTNRESNTASRSSATRGSANNGILNEVESIIATILRAVTKTDEQSSSSTTEGDSVRAIIMPAEETDDISDSTVTSEEASTSTADAAEHRPQTQDQLSSSSSQVLSTSTSTSRLQVASTRNASGKPVMRNKDFTSSAMSELKTNSALSTPLECARTCTENEPPKTCYYHFTVEMYNVLGAACELCTPNATNVVWSNCQCVLADGVERSFLSINRMLPGPSIQVCENDSVIIDVENHMQGMELTIHWHGITQEGTQYYDGVPFVTQCPIHQGNSFRYQWKSVSGTHFYHAHTGLQKLDGILGTIVVRQPPSKDPNSDLYDYDLPEHVVMLSDWLHVYSIEKFPGNLVNHTGQSPDSILVNGKGQSIDPNTGLTTNTSLEMFTVTSGNKYRFRMVNSFATICPAMITIEGHNLTIIATDGEPVKPVQVNSIISFSGERYDFVIEANNATDAYWIQVRGLGECGVDRMQQLAILRYETGPYLPSSEQPTYDEGIPRGVVMNPLDAICNIERPEAICVNQLKNAKEIDSDVLKETPDVKIFLPFRFYDYIADLETLFQPHTYNPFSVVASGDLLISLVDEVSYQAAPAPLLSQYNDIDPEQFCNGDNRPADCGENCMCTHKIDVPLNAVVEIILVDEVQIANLSHPFHLHGHSYNVIGMGRSADTNVTSINLQHVIDLDRRGLLDRHLNSLPPLKDTLAVPNNGYVVLRVKATNPGFWLLHCHFLYHIDIGMNVIIQVGTQADLPPVPANFPRCGNFLPPISIN